MSLSVVSCSGIGCNSDEETSKLNELKQDDPRLVKSMLLLYYPFKIFKLDVFRSNNNHGLILVFFNAYSIKIILKNLNYISPAKLKTQVYRINDETLISSDYTKNSIVIFFMRHSRLITFLNYRI